MVITANHIPQCRKTLFYSLYLYRVWERISQMLQFLVCSRGWHEETLAVAVYHVQLRLAILIPLPPKRVMQFLFSNFFPFHGSNAFTYPAVNRPTMRVPAIVAWQIGMTSCNSASKTLHEKEEDRISVFRPLLNPVA